MDSDFKILKRKNIYQGKIFTLQQVWARLPDGREPIYDLIEHPGAVAMIPLDGQGNILFVRQYRAGVGATLLEIPAGTLEKDEEPSNCAERELREEIGMAARSLKKLGQFYLAPGYSSELLHIFLASDLYEAPLARDADEYMHITPIKTEKVYEMARRGEFQDAKTLAAFLLAQPYLLGS